MVLLNELSIFLLFCAMVDPAVYPYFDIYPTVNGRWSPQPSREEQQSVASSTSTSGVMNLAPILGKFGTAYPRLNICKFISPVLPFRLIELKLTLDLRDASIPCYGLDPAVYPNFDIYPNISGFVEKRKIAGQYYWPLLRGYAYSSCEVAPIPSVWAVNTSGPSYPVIEIC